MEEWKNVKNYENEYEVSNLGNIRRKIKNLKLGKSKHGYYHVSLCKNGICETKLVHILVANAFHDNPENKEQVNHMDCIKTNNLSTNLEWNTFQENMEHAIKNHRQRNQSGINNNMVKLTEDDVIRIRKLKESGLTTYKIHKNYFPNLHQQTIYAIIQRRLWKHI